MKTCKNFQNIPHISKHHLQHHPSKTKTKSINTWNLFSKTTYFGNKWSKNSILSKHVLIRKLYFSILSNMTLNAWHSCTQEEE